MFTFVIFGIQILDFYTNNLVCIVFFRRVYDSGEQPVMVLTRQNLTALVIYIVVDDLLED